MIDFIKYEIKNIDINRLKRNRYLEFKSKLNLKTGEIYPFAEAKYKGMTFKIYKPTHSNPNGRVTLEGSLHKYRNDGKHNFDDFSSNDVYSVINELKFKFHIDPCETTLRQLEIGINISPRHNVNDIISGCISHYKKPFKSTHTKTKGNYIIVAHQRYSIKIYDKKLQYKNRFEIKDELLRFEIKFTKMMDLNNMDIVSLNDLLKFGLKNFKSLLIKRWEEILFYDKTVFKDHKYELIYSNPNYWEELNVNLFKYHKKELNKCIRKSSVSIKKDVRILIEDKFNSLR